MRGRVQLTHVTYLGGHPSREKPKSNGVLVVDDGGFHMRGLSEIFTIPWPEIAEVAVEGPEETSKRITATRMVTMGIFAVAAKKKTGTTFIGVRTAAYSAGFEVEKRGAGQVRGLLAQWTNDLGSGNAPGVAASPPSVADELTKLAALRDQGVLSEQEFIDQKGRLLGRS